MTRAALLTLLLAGWTSAYAQGLGVCGDGVIDPRFEQCDQGTQNGAPGSCCTVDCRFRPPGDVCRPAQDPVCDVEERCNGQSGACPADRFAVESTPCTLADPCAIQDHCATGKCVPRATVCGGTVSQPFRQTPTGLVPRPRIDLLCQVDRTLFTGATKGGSCRAVAFRRQASPAGLAGTAPTYTCTALGEGAPDCTTAHSGDLRMTKRQRKKLGRDGSAVVRMNLNPLARKALQNGGSLDADVCGTIRLPGGITTQLECSLTLRAGSSTRTRPAESRPRAGRRS